MLDQLLFIIYTYGLTDVLSNCSMRLYADDLLLYWPIQSPTDYQALQADIDALSDWVSAHKLQFNCDKCKCMLVSQKRNPTVANYVISQWPTTRESVYSYKYLGILLTSNLAVRRKLFKNVSFVQDCPWFH